MEKKQRVGLIVLGVGVMAVGIGVWWSYGRTDPDREAILRLLQQFETAVEAGDVGQFEEGLTLDYGDRFGHDRETVTQRVMDTTRDIGNLDVQLSQIEIDLDADTGRAGVKFRVELVGDGAEMDPDAEELRSRRRVVLQVRKEGLDWRAHRADVVYSLF